MEEAWREACLRKNLFDRKRALRDILGVLEQADVARHPHDQYALALQAIAWRLAGDPRYPALYDYETLVRAWTVEPPQGWSSLPAYLADLAEGLKALHTVKTHPIGQSLRHGSQTSQDLFQVDHPAIRALPEALNGAIRAHLAALGQGRDVVRSRNTGGYAYRGLWSVRLRPDGFHADHVHPEGWLSSAFYVELPDAVHGEGREGWIKFGEPGLPTRPPLAAEHFVKPEPGRLVLFPSYIWHGTVPFGGTATRLPCAFDLAPG